MSQRNMPQGHRTYLDLSAKPSWRTKAANVPVWSGDRQLSGLAKATAEGLQPPARDGAPDRRSAT